MFAKNKPAKYHAKGESVICNKTIIEGKVFFQSSIQIYGSISGNLTGQSDQSKVMIFNEGKVRGDIRAANVLVDGHVSGNIVCRHIDIHPNARISGDVYYEVLQMQANSVINGQLVISDEYSKGKEYKQPSSIDGDNQES